MIIWRTFKKKKKSRPKNAKIAELRYFEKNDFEIYEPDFWDIWEKLILKPFMHRTISNCFKCILNCQYVSEVYFTWRRLCLTLLTSFYGYNAFGCIYILLTLKNKKRISVHQLLYFRDMFLNVISLDFCKKLRNVNFDLNSVFSPSCKISFADLWSPFMERIIIIERILKSQILIEGLVQGYYKE